MLCRHCHRYANRVRGCRRGLCRKCYDTPGLQEVYQSTSKFANRGVRDFYGKTPLPLWPTAAMPGTPEKVAVMYTRALLGTSLFHPADAS